VFFKILSINVVHSGVLFILFYIVNWLDVEGLNIDAERPTSKVGVQSPCAPPPHCNPCDNREKCLMAVTFSGGGGNVVHR